MQTPDILLRAWGRLQEPRVLSALQGAVYVVVATVGALSLWVPVPTVENTVGTTLATLWASLLLLGGVLGIISVVSAAWWLERIALMAIIVSLLMFGVTIAGGPHQRGTQIALLGLVTWATLSSVQHAVRIHRYPYDPER